MSSPPPTSTGWTTASQKKLIKDDTRVNLLGNRLVLIAPKDSKIGNVTIGPGFDLAKLAGDGRIATGDVRAVPVGKYAKAALEKLGAWAAVEPKIAMAENVRAALALVARGEAPLGIVYATDAKVEPNVKIVGAFPADSHPAIVYPVALTVTAKPEAAQYLAFLRSQAAKTMFENYGFSYPDPADVVTVMAGHSRPKDASHAPPMPGHPRAASTLLSVLRSWIARYGRA